MIRVGVGGNAELGFELLVFFRRQIRAFEQRAPQVGSHLGQDLTQRHDGVAELHLGARAGVMEDALEPADDRPLRVGLQSPGVPAVAAFLAGAATSGGNQSRVESSSVSNATTG